MQTDKQTHHTLHSDVGYKHQLLNASQFAREIAIHVAIHLAYVINDLRH